MKKKLFSRVISIIVVLVLTLTALPMTISAAPPKVSTKSYEISFTGGPMYLCNEKIIQGNVGEKMYITYTVADVISMPQSASQQGLLGCDDFSGTYPYQSGALYYNSSGNEVLMKEGYTYFIEFVVTKDGFDYTIGMAKGEKSTYQYLGGSTAGTYPVTHKMQYLGLFLDGAGINVKLSNVHIYDVKGNDLGIDGRGVSDAVEITSPVPPSKIFNGSYTITVKDVFNLYIGNRTRNTTDKQYFEFYVKSSNSRIYQTGVWVNCLDTNRTDGDYQHTNKNYDNPPPSDFLHVGARYLVTCSNTYKATQGWDVLVQRTNPDGTTEWFRFNKGAYPKSANNNGYSQLSFGEGTNYISNFVLTDFRIYDANHKDLGVMSNNSIEVERFGEISYYDECEAMYYNYDTNAYITTYADKTVQLTENGKTRQGTYKVVNGILNAKFGNSVEKFEHTRNFLKDMEGKRWEAIGHVKASFVTGTDEKIPEQKLKLSEGYKVTKPKDPTLKGDEFVCWVTSTGEEYKFGEVQPDSITLYAKWKNNAGKTYIAVDGKAEKVDLTIYIVIGLSVLVAAAAVAGCIIILRRNKK